MRANTNSNRTFGQLLACRTLMGVFEAAFLPCAVYYCSLFYTRRELGFRTAIFYQMGVIAVRNTSNIHFWIRADGFYATSLLPVA